MKTFRGVILGICVAVSISVFAASLWPNGPWLETFQNGFLFGNGSIFSALNSVPKFDDRRLDDRNKDYYFQEDFEGGTVSFTCGANLTATDETGSPIAGSTSKLITQAAGALNQVCESSEIMLDEKQKDALNQVCINAIGENFDLIAYDSTNANELGRISIEDTSKTYCLEFLTIPSTNALTYRLEAVNEVVASTLKFDDVQFRTNPLNFRNFLEVNSVELNGTDGRAITVSTESISWNGSGNGWVSGANGSNFTNGNYYEVQKNNSIVEIDGSIAFTANLNNYIGLYLNGAFYKIVSAFNTTTRKKFQFTSIKGEFSAGDKLSFGSNAAGFTSNTSPNLSYLRINEFTTSKHVVVNSGEGDFDTIDKILSADVTANGVISDFTISASSLEYGAEYAVYGTLFPNSPSNDTWSLRAYDGTTQLDNWSFKGEGATHVDTQQIAFTFKHEGGDITFDVSGFSSGVALRGDGSKNESFIQYRKINKNEYHLVPVSDQENDFTARVLANSDVASATLGFISSSDVALSDTSLYTIDISKLGLTQIPTVIAKLDNVLVTTATTSIRDAKVQSVTTTQIVVRTHSNNSSSSTITAYAALPFSLYIKRQGADYQEPKVFLGNFGQPACIIKDVKASSVSGGDFNSGSWITRELNTIEGTCSFLSLSLNEITLDKGSYIIEGFAPAHAVNTHQARIYNVSDATVSFYGGSMFAFATNSVTNTSIFYGKITLNSSKTLRVEHRASSTKTTDGLGTGNPFGGDNIFTTVKITKVK